ncbi:hypothetical protein [Halovenus salina]|uniref:Amphi-Trp domain-containing protein n=1 Tax=Halovenus salina TaxID=1510225 RepID=A0ABD5W1Q3_9EURY|nr:hypothetical protein [Halovenus salina]
MSSSKVTGTNVLAFIESTGEVSPVFASKAREIFADHGITDPAEDEWYDAENYLDALFAFVEEVGDMSVQQAGREMVRVNKPIMEKDEIDDGMATFAEQHKRTHKNWDYESDGRVEYEQVDATTYRISTTGGYRHPETLLRGASKEVVIQTSNATHVEIEETEPNPNEVHAFELHW